MTKKEVHPWELIQNKTISKLVFAYESVLTEMRSHAKANRTIKEWVKRLDFEHDEFVASMLVVSDKPTQKECLHCKWPAGTRVEVAYADGESGELGVIVENPDIRVRFEEHGAMEVTFPERRLRRAIATKGPNADG